MPRRARFCPPVVAVALLAGCADEPDAESAPAAPGPLEPVAFDPARCGRVTGRVAWAGPPPEAAPFLFSVPRPDGSVEARLVPNPNVPDVDPATRAVRGAVVFLRGVDPHRARRWDLPPARVELADRNVRVRQGDGPARRAGFVRRGEAVTVASAEPVYHALRGRGAATFSLALPDPDRPRAWVLPRAGRVELTSAAGYYWASGDLFVDDHPYYTHTAGDGRFAFEQVPDGPVEVVAWLPGWGVVRQDRDPESGLLTRQEYTPPVEAAVRAAVAAGRTADVAVEVAAPRP